MKSSRQVLLATTSYKGLIYKNETYFFTVNAILKIKICEINPVMAIVPLRDFF